MSTSKQKAITQQRRLRLHERAAKQAAKQPEQAESRKRDTGPSVTRYEPEAPPWARPDWKPAATGPAVSESLAAWQRAQEWAAVRARCCGGGYDDMGNRIDRAPAGFHPLFGWKL